METYPQQSNVSKQCRLTLSTSWDGRRIHISHWIFSTTICAPMWAVEKFMKSFSFSAPPQWHYSYIWMFTLISIYVYLNSPPVAAPAARSKPRILCLFNRSQINLFAFSSHHPIDDVLLFAALQFVLIQDHKRHGDSSSFCFCSLAFVFFFQQMYLACIYLNIFEDFFCEREMKTVNSCCGDIRKECPSISDSNRLCQLHALFGN